MKKKKKQFRNKAIVLGSASVIIAYALALMLFVGAAKGHEAWKEHKSMKTPLQNVKTK